MNFERSSWGIRTAFLIYRTPSEARKSRGFRVNNWLTKAICIFSTNILKLYIFVVSRPLPVNNVIATRRILYSSINFFKCINLKYFDKINVKLIKFFSLLTYTIHMHLWNYVVAAWLLVNVFYTCLLRACRIFYAHGK